MTIEYTIYINGKPFTASADVIDTVIAGLQLGGFEFDPIAETWQHVKIVSEEHKAADALGNILTSVMERAYATTPQSCTSLYSWEREGLAWLIRFKDRNPHGLIGNDWIAAFVSLNHDAIMSPDGKMNFNLRAVYLQEFGRGQIGRF